MAVLVRAQHREHLLRIAEDLHSPSREALELQRIVGHSTFAAADMNETMCGRVHRAIQRQVWGLGTRSTVEPTAGGENAMACDVK